MKQVRALSLMLFISVLSMSGYSQAKDLAKLSVKPTKAKKAIVPKMLTTGVPFKIGIDVAPNGCHGTLNQYPSGVVSSLILTSYFETEYPSETNLPNVDCSGIPASIATCDNVQQAYCVLLIHPSDVFKDTDGFWKPITNARVIGCCYRTTGS